MSGKPQRALKEFLFGGEPVRSHWREESCLAHHCERTKKGEAMANRLKHLVSKRKRRFVENGFDLDLTCILTKLICMIYVAKSTKHTLLVPICGHGVCVPKKLYCCSVSCGVWEGDRLEIRVLCCLGKLAYIDVCWIELASSWLLSL